MQPRLLLMMPRPELILLQNITVSMKARNQVLIICREKRLLTMPLLMTRPLVLTQLICLLQTPGHLN
jgi:hypothetical protein